MAMGATSSLAFSYIVLPWLNKVFTYLLTNYYGKLAVTLSFQKIEFVGLIRQFLIDDLDYTDS